MISFSKVNKQYGKQVLFVDASFQLNPGEKVGLVGPNGAGKTTLFRMIVGEETPDDGDVSVPKRTTQIEKMNRPITIEGTPVMTSDMNRTTWASGPRPPYSLM